MIDLTDITEAIHYVRNAPWPSHSATHEEAALMLAAEIERITLDAPRPDPDRNPMPSDAASFNIRQDFQLLRDRWGDDAVRQVAASFEATFLEPIDDDIKPLTFHVSADYNIDSAARKISEIVEYLDLDSIRGGILIVPTFKEQ